MRVFITGASSGIGEALAREYSARHPDALIGLCARRGQRLEALAAALPARCRCYPLDVTDRASLAAAGNDFLQHAGGVDRVIANAGISAGTATGEPGDGETFARIVQTNLCAMHDTFAPFVPAMRSARHGALVGVASVAGIRGLPGAGAYSASKAGAIAYLESLRVELRGSGVGVVTLAPGFVRTPLTERNRYPMPFLTEVDAFARRAVDAIERGRDFCVIPWQMGVIARVLRLLPRPIYDRAFARAPRKQRATVGGSS
ncbi:MAG: SDR family oxidoreductase [Burkholderiaceae bacterium]|nr:SDR family oxidoreductase [Burkholderiaceae bacterium]